MPAPSLTAAITWGVLEKAVISVFREALSELAKLPQLPRAEEPINLELYWIVRRVHLAQMKSDPANMLPFLVLFDSNNQPEPDDAARSQRLRKRPDFNCALTNPQALDYSSSQVNYYLECKRLGQAEGTWVLNENYSEHGVRRFVHTSWQYGKGCQSATMIGYVQTMPPASVLTEVNNGMTSRGYPSLTRAAASWAAQNVTALTQGALPRGFQPNGFSLGHLWIDLRHCQFVVTGGSPPASAPKAPEPPKLGRRGRLPKGAAKKRS